MQWFERRFVFDLPVELLPNVLERLRGTPARLEERLRGVSRDVLVAKPDGTWSAQENVGHLLDLEALWIARVEDFRMSREELSPADLGNERTHRADHNRRSIDDLLSAFRGERERLVAQFSSLGSALDHRARHPRLNVAMRPIDHAVFVAEHDDHHLVRIAALIAP
jgi:hypothetical protein